MLRAIWWSPTAFDGNALRAGRRSACWRTTAQRLLRRLPTQPDGRWRSVSPARRREPVRSPPASTTAARAGNVTFIADVRTAKIADLVVIKDGSVADGATANTLRARVTDAFGAGQCACRTDGQRVGRTTGNGRRTTVADVTQAGRHGGNPSPARRRASVRSPPTINSSSQSRNVTFIADVRTAQIADLVVTQDNSVADGATANTLRARVTDAFGNALAGQTVSVLADNGRNGRPTVTDHTAGRHGGDQCHQPDGGESVRSPPASTTAARAGT